MHSEALARLRSSEGNRNQKRLPSYSMNTDILPSLGRQKRRLSDAMPVMTLACIGRVASKSLLAHLSRWSLACCRRLENRDLYLSFARPPAATSTFITCSASEMLMRNSSCAQTAKSMAVYLLLLLSKLALTPKSSQYSTQETHPSRAAASKEYPGLVKRCRLVLWQPVYLWTTA